MNISLQTHQSIQPGASAKSVEAIVSPVAILYILDRAIGAVKAISDPDSGFERRVFCQLQQKQELWILGPGFDKRTVLCRLGEELYYLFAADLGIEQRAKAATV